MSPLVQGGGTSSPHHLRRSLAGRTVIRVIIPQDLAEAVRSPVAIHALSATNLFDCLEQLDVSHPGLRRRVLEVDGVVRPHLNVFVDDLMERRRDARTIPLHDGAEVWIMRAVSGG